LSAICTPDTTSNNHPCDPFLQLEAPSSGSRRGDGLGLEDSLKEVLDNLVLALLAGALDLLDLDLGLLVRLVLGGLVSLGVL
jgi:hypothetical protein